MATVHRHGHLHGEALAAAAGAAVNAAGEQWTPMRAKVFGVLSGFSKPASAYDIAEALSRSEGRRVAANSVYRILDLFVAADVARRIESVNAYVANAHPDCPHDCIFLICDGCGAMQHLDDDGIAADVRRAAKAADFHVERPVIEVRGTCRACGAVAAA